MASANVSAVMFVKDLRRVARFYVEAFGMKCRVSDDDHWLLDCGGFTLIVHQIPREIAAGITIEQPPSRRVWGTTRLDFPVASIASARSAARSLGGAIDDDPPQWADRNANFFLGYDPEGNVFGVSQQPVTSPS